MVFESVILWAGSIIGLLFVFEAGLCACEVVMNCRSLCQSGHSSGLPALNRMAPGCSGAGMRCLKRTTTNSNRR